MFSTIPPEIWLEILGYVPYKDLCNLLLVSKNFNIMLQPCDSKTRSALDTNFFREAIPPNPPLSPDFRCHPALLSLENFAVPRGNSVPYFGFEFDGVLDYLDTFEDIFWFLSSPDFKNSHVAKENATSPPSRNTVLGFPLSGHSRKKMEADVPGEPATVYDVMMITLVGVLICWAADDRALHFRNLKAKIAEMEELFLMKAQEGEDMKEMGAALDLLYKTLAENRFCPAKLFSHERPCLSLTESSDPKENSPWPRFRTLEAVDDSVESINTLLSRAGYL